MLLGDPRPVIAPPEIDTLLDACVDIVPRPKFVLDVPAFATSLKLFDAVSLPSNCVCALELKVFINWNSEFVTLPSAILVASIPVANCEFNIVPVNDDVG